MIIMPSKKGRGCGEGGRNALMFSRSGGSKPSDKLFDIRTMKSTCSGKSGGESGAAAKFASSPSPPGLYNNWSSLLCVPCAVSLSGLDARIADCAHCARALFSPPPFLVAVLLTGFRSRNIYNTRASCAHFPLFLLFFSPSSSPTGRQ